MSKAVPPDQHCRNCGRLLRVKRFKRFHGDSMYVWHTWCESGDCNPFGGRIYGLTRSEAIQMWNGFYAQREARQKGRG